MKMDKPASLPRKVADRSVRSHLRKTVALAFVLATRGYQLAIRPHLIGTCKFFPSCSDYAVEAVTIHGPYRGLALAIRRLCRCHPFTPGGLDPVPVGEANRAADPAE